MAPPVSIRANGTSRYRCAPTARSADSLVQIVSGRSDSMPVKASSPRKRPSRRRDSGTPMFGGVLPGIQRRPSFFATRVAGHAAFHYACLT